VQTVIVDDEPGARAALAAEFQRLGEPEPVTFGTKEEALRFHRALTPDSRSHFVVDLDLGEGKEREGVALVKELHHQHSLASRQTLISALSSHSELREAALAAGADQFVPKMGVSKDALRLKYRAATFDVDQSESRAREIEIQLARHEFEELRNVTRLVRKGKMNASAPLNKVRKLLALRYLTSDALQVLSALDEQLSNKAPDRLSHPEYRQLIHAISLLESAEDEGLREWIHRAHARNADIIIPWLENADLGEEGDEE
jgi:DNA-binding NarL/FixJ family response regulator